MHSEAVICFRLLMVMLGAKADPWLASGLLFVQKKNCDSCSCALFLPGFLNDRSLVAGPGGLPLPGGCVILKSLGSTWEP